MIFMKCPIILIMYLLFFTINIGTYCLKHVNEFHVIIFWLQIYYLCIFFRKMLCPFLYKATSIMFEDVCVILEAAYDINITGLHDLWGWWVDLLLQNQLLRYEKITFPSFDSCCFSKKSIILRGHGGLLCWGHRYPLKSYLLWCWGHV